MTPTLGYLLALLAITFVIDFTLRALPFKILEPLRDSRFVSNMAVWMPPGIMLILVLSTLTQGAQEAGRWWAALVATGVTVANRLPPNGLNSRAPTAPTNCAKPRASAGCPLKVAGNLTWLFFETLHKRCNPNNLISKPEILAVELHAKLPVGSHS